MVFSYLFLLLRDLVYVFILGVSHAILETFTKCVVNVANLNNWEDDTDTIKLYLLLVLCKLKTSMTFACLSVLFNIHSTTCARIFYKYVSLLAVSVRPAIYWPIKEEILKNMPKYFEKFKATRIVLDATEIKVQKLKCLKCRIMSYSNYKCCHTMKFLIGITPSGLISCVSKGYGGRASYKSIFNSEKIIDKLDPFDAIMVDKGILIEVECNERLVKLIRPPFLQKKKQLTENDAMIMADIARARVHVERAIQRLKMFKIFNNQIDWFMIPYIEDIMVVIASIVNMSPPILADNKF